eukprot:4380617-Pyramimonas_sp.AAC.1
MGGVSRGLHDEATRVTFRDWAADFLAAQGKHDKSAVRARRILIHPKAPTEKLHYCYSDGARELARARR